MPSGNPPLIKSLGGPITIRTDASGTLHLHRHFILNNDNQRPENDKKNELNSIRNVIHPPTLNPPGSDIQSMPIGLVPKSIPANDSKLSNNISYPVLRSQIHSNGGYAPYKSLAQTNHTFKDCETIISTTSDPLEAQVPFIPSKSKFNIELLPYSLQKNMVGLSNNSTSRIFPQLSTQTFSKPRKAPISVSQELVDFERRMKQRQILADVVVEECVEEDDQHPLQPQGNSTVSHICVSPRATGTHNIFSHGLEEEKGTKDDSIVQNDLQSSAPAIFISPCKNTSKFDAEGFITSHINDTRVSPSAINNKNNITPLNNADTNFDKSIICLPPPPPYEEENFFTQSSSLKESSPSSQQLKVDSNQGCPSNYASTPSKLGKSASTGLLSVKRMQSIKDKKSKNKDLSLLDRKKKLGNESKKISSTNNGLSSSASVLKLIAENAPLLLRAFNSEKTTSDSLSSKENFFDQQKNPSESKSNNLENNNDLLTDKDEATVIIISKNGKIMASTLSDAHKMLNGFSSPQPAHPEDNKESENKHKIQAYPSIIVPEIINHNIKDGEKKAILSKMDANPLLVQHQEIQIHSLSPNPVILNTSSHSLQQHPISSTPINSNSTALKSALSPRFKERSSTHLDQNVTPNISPPYPVVKSVSLKDPLPVRSTSVNSSHRQNENKFAVVAQSEDGLVKQNEDDTINATVQTLKKSYSLKDNKINQSSIAINQVTSDNSSSQYTTYQNPNSSSFRAEKRSAPIAFVPSASILYYSNNNNNQNNNSASNTHREHPFHSSGRHHISPLASPYNNTLLNQSSTAHNFDLLSPDDSTSGKDGVQPVYLNASSSYTHLYNRLGSHYSNTKLASTAPLNFEKRRRVNSVSASLSGPGPMAGIFRSQSASRIMRRDLNSASSLSVVDRASFMSTSSSSRKNNRNSNDMSVGEEALDISKIGEIYNAKVVATDKENEKERAAIRISQRRYSTSSCGTEKLLTVGLNFTSESEDFTLKKEDNQLKNESDLSINQVIENDEFNYVTMPLNLNEDPSRQFINEDNLTFTCKLSEVFSPVQASIGAAQGCLSESQFLDDNTEETLHKPGDLKGSDPFLLDSHDENYYVHDANMDKNSNMREFYTNQYDHPNPSQEILQEKIIDELHHENLSGQVPTVQNLNVEKQVHGESNNINNLDENSPAKKKLKKSKKEKKSSKEETTPAPVAEDLRPRALLQSLNMMDLYDDLILQYGEEGYFAGDADTLFLQVSPQGGHQPQIASSAPQEDGLKHLPNSGGVSDNSRVDPLVMTDEWLDVIEYSKHIGLFDTMKSTIQSIPNGLNITGFDAEEAVGHTDKIKFDRKESNSDLDCENQSMANTKDQENLPTLDVMGSILGEKQRDVAPNLQTASSIQFAPTLHDYKWNSQNSIKAVQEGVLLTKLFMPILKTELPRPWVARNAKIYIPLPPSEINSDTDENSMSDTNDIVNSEDDDDDDYSNSESSNEIIRRRRRQRRTARQQPKYRTESRIYFQHLGTQVTSWTHPFEDFFRNMTKLLRKNISNVQVDSTVHYASKRFGDKKLVSIPDTKYLQITTIKLVGKALENASLHKTLSRGTTSMILTCAALCPVKQQVNDAAVATAAQRAQNSLASSQVDEKIASKQKSIEVGGQMYAESQLLKKTRRIRASTMLLISQESEEALLASSFGSNSDSDESFYTNHNQSNRLVNSTILKQKTSYIADDAPVFQKANRDYFFASLLRRFSESPFTLTSDDVLHLVNDVSRPLPLSLSVNEKGLSEAIKNAFTDIVRRTTLESLYGVWEGPYKRRIFFDDNNDLNDAKNTSGDEGDHSEVQGGLFWKLLIPPYHRQSCGVFNSVNIHDSQSHLSGLDKTPANERIDDPVISILHETLVKIDVLKYFWDKFFVSTKGLFPPCAAPDFIERVIEKIKIAVTRTPPAAIEEMHQKELLESQHSNNKLNISGNNNMSGGGGTILQKNQIEKPKTPLQRSSLLVNSNGNYLNASNQSSNNNNTLNVHNSFGANAHRRMSIMNLMVISSPHSSPQGIDTGSVLNSSKNKYNNNAKDNISDFLDSALKIDSNSRISISSAPKNEILQPLHRTSDRALNASSNSILQVPHRAVAYPVQAPFLIENMDLSTKNAANKSNPPNIRTGQIPGTPRSGVASWHALDTNGNSSSNMDYNEQELHQAPNIQYSRYTLDNNNNNNNNNHFNNTNHNHSISNNSSMFHPRHYSATLDQNRPPPLNDSKLFPQTPQSGGAPL